MRPARCSSREATTSLHAHTGGRGSSAGHRPASCSAMHRIQQPAPASTEHRSQFTPWRGKKVLRRPSHLSRWRQDRPAACLEGKGALADRQQREQRSEWFDNLRHGAATGAVAAPVAMGPSSPRQSERRQGWRRRGWKPARRNLADEFLRGVRCPRGSDTRCGVRCG